MTTPETSAHDERVHSLAVQYKAEGYSVQQEPPADALPFDLGTYRPDIVARKGDGGLIVEVRTSAARTGIERFLEIAQRVREHPGWRFLLVTVDDLSAATEGEPSTWEQLQRKIGEARELAGRGGHEPATLYLWAVWEAAMRRLAIEEAIPVERLPATRVMNQLYTLGYISAKDLTAAKDYLRIRNRLTHGFQLEVERARFDTFVEVVERSVSEWMQANRGGKDA